MFVFKGKLWRSNLEKVILQNVGIAEVDSQQLFPTN